MNIHERPDRIATDATDVVDLKALAGVPLVKAGDDLVAIIMAALATSNETLRSGDILVLTQKIVSKAQNRLVELLHVSPSPRAEALTREVNKDARLVELILRESSEVVRHCRDVLIVAHRRGWVMANAGIDQSNVEQHDGDDVVLLLPDDPDGTCAELRAALRAATGADVGIIINDSHGRAFRNGTVGVAIGAAGISALVDRRGAPDLYRRRLRITEIGLADEIASAASLLMGQANEGRPIVLVRGLSIARGDGCAADLLRAKSADLFRSAATPDIVELISGRHSIRQYTKEPVADALVEQILAAAVSAPSAHNRQPWRFAVLKSETVKLRLANAMGERLRQDRKRDGDDIESIEADVRRSISRIAGAPIVIVVCITMEDMEAYPDERRSTAERIMAVQGTAMAMQNLLLAAHALRLGASVMCAPLFCQDKVRAELALPVAWEPQALITLGVPANGSKPCRRRPLGDFVRTVD